VTYSLISPELQLFYRSRHWKKIRADWFRKYGRWCRACNSTRSVQLHHLTYKRWKYPWARDMTALCWRCHEDVTVECRRRRGPGRKVDIAAVTWQYVYRKRTELKLAHRRLKPSPWPVRLLLWFRR
jgi:hypothetical protein